MSVRRKGRPLRRALVARLSAVGALAATLVPALASPASAFQPCPSEGIPNWEVYSFDTTWPTPGANPRGVTMCLAHAEQPLGYVQIVDLNDGASLFMASEQVNNSNHPSLNYYTKKSAAAWHGSLVTPGRVTRFSTVNAGFFTHTGPGTTYMSLPTLTNGGLYRSYGWALYDNSDLAWPAPKKKLVMSIDSGYQHPQRVRIGEFPTYYTGVEVEEAFDRLGPDGTYNGLVSFAPEYVVPGGDVENRRTMVGVDEAGGKVYILATFQSITLARGRAILKHFGSTDEIQLDGGGSTQLYSGFGSIPSNLGRTVPSVLRVITSWR